MAGLFRQISTLGLLSFSIGIQAAPDELDRLLQQQQYQQAYQLAEQIKLDWEGDPNFDLPYGLAAMHSGHYREALFAFERVRISQPNNARIQLEMGRAYFALGDDTNATAEFNAALANQPPETVANNVRSYLEQIQQRQNQQQPHWSGELSGSLGHDSNINSATQAQFVDFGPIAQIELSPNSRSLSDEFSELNANLNFIKPLSKTQGLFAQLDYAERNNFGSNEFDSRTLQLRAGGQSGWGLGQLRGQVAWQQMQLADQGFLKQPSLALDYLLPQGQNQAWQIFGQFGQRRFAQNERRDVDFGVLGVGWLWHRDNLQFNLSTYAGDDDASEQRNALFGRNYRGLRVGSELKHNQHRISTMIAYQSSRQDGPDLLTNTSRTEHLWQFNLNDRYQLSPHWWLQPEYQYAHNQSNSVLYQYRRHQLSLSLGYGF